MRTTLERLFGLGANGTSVPIELAAGLTTFLTMSYILVVNPQILAAAGIDRGAAFTATCLAAALGSLAMGLIANYPIALAPGMGINAYFTYTVVLGMGVPWQTALGAVFLSGVAFLLVSVLKVREWLVNSIPLSLKLGIGAGIGLFLGLLGFQGMGLVVAKPATMIGLGDVADPKVLIACGGFVLMAGLAARQVPGAILIAVAAATLAGVPLGLTLFSGVVSAPPSLAPTLLQLDLAGALKLSMASVVFAFFLVGLLDNMGTLIATIGRAGLMRADGTVPRLGRVMLADSGGAMVGAVLGTSNTVSYIESASGIAAGGRTGLASVATAGLFLACLFIAPLALAVPAFATAPALVFVALAMMAPLKDLPWDDPAEALPAALTALGIVFTFSIATGIGLGFIAYAAVKLIAGRGREVSGAVWAIALASALLMAVE
ncbi:NCS2 family permease [Xanthobacter tagetidis]|uniref:NCS2 family permease n=1 Tax=Xanthobacter tagetidis TaxID=60216 RepID=A0A3L6ZXU6_9HYPH|nr:NCS2 family permease [Xanthobacter tagetidis]MBB6310125.1 AGZA family xanthine/uracil permease-like MFS transporter [Xanthobacter tagetidis]RLP72739.1 NCS2 family permease [Xanthobacter tagetidis]